MKTEADHSKPSVPLTLGSLVGKLRIEVVNDDCSGSGLFSLGNKQTDKQTHERNWLVTLKRSTWRSFVDTRRENGIRVGWYAQIIQDPIKEVNSTRTCRHKVSRQGPLHSVNLIHSRECIKLQGMNPSIKAFK